MGYLPYQLVSRISSINSRPRFKDSKNLVISFPRDLESKSPGRQAHSTRSSLPWLFFVHREDRSRFPKAILETKCPCGGFIMTYHVYILIYIYMYIQIYIYIYIHILLYIIYVTFKCPWSNKTCEQYSGPRSKKETQKKTETSSFRPFRGHREAKFSWRYSWIFSTTHERMNLDERKRKTLHPILWSFQWRGYKDSFLAPPVHIFFISQPLDLWSIPPVTTTMAGACFFFHKKLSDIRKKASFSTVALRIWIRAQPQVSSSNKTPPVAWSHGLLTTCSCTNGPFVILIGCWVSKLPL